MVNGSILVKAGDVVLGKIRVNSHIVMKTKDIIARSVRGSYVMTKGPTGIVEGVWDEFCDGSSTVFFITGCFVNCFRGYEFLI